MTLNGRIITPSVMAAMDREQCIEKNSKSLYRADKILRLGEEVWKFY